MISYEYIQQQDLNEVTALYEKYLNAGEFIRQQVADDFASPGFLGVKAVVDDKIVGVLYGKDSLTLTYPHPEAEKKLAEATRGHKVHYSDALAIHEDYRHHDISAGMFGCLKKRLLEKGYELLFGELWKYPDGRMPAYGPVSHLGPFYYSLEVPGFYKELERYGVSCPVCGKHCRCSARLVLVWLDEALGKEKYHGA